MMETLRQVPVRLLHPIRRRTAMRRIRRWSPPGRILFVCEGNLCRSPYAAAIFERGLAPALRHAILVSSAGFIGADRSPPSEAIRVGGNRGVTLEHHRSMLLHRELVRAASLIVVMDPLQGKRLRAVFGAHPARIVVLGDLDPEPIRSRTIRDPISGPEKAFEESYERIDRCMDPLLGAIRDREGAGARGSLDPASAAQLRA